MHAPVIRYFIQNALVVTQCLKFFDLLGHMQHHLRVYVVKEVFPCDSTLFIFKAAFCY